MGSQGGERATAVGSRRQEPAADSTREEETIEASLAALVSDAEKLLDRPYVRDWPKVEYLDDGREVEVIESEEFVTVLIDAPGCRRGELSAQASADVVKVRGPDFQVRRALPCLVDRSSMATELRNGVFSLRLSKMQLF